MNLLKYLFGTKNDRELKRLWPIVREINLIEEGYQQKNFSDADFPRMTNEFRERVKNGESLDKLLPEAYALVKNACRHLMGTTAEVCGHTLTWNMIPFDVQLLGGIVLHQGKISEMQTGEGKTLVATFPLYLNALTGKNVQLVTVNDYLAMRDATWMGHLYRYLGLTVGCIQNSMDPEQRRAQYSCDITYGTNSEFGFDYLRDNGMAQDPESVVQNGHNFAIVDEVDSILIDEARTPLIISGPATMSTEHIYTGVNPMVASIVKVQIAQCNGFIQEAKKALADGDIEKAKDRLYQVYHSTPKHKQFMHMLEDAEIRALHEKVEMQMLSEMFKEHARALKEDLYFTIDERTREVALTDKGCETICPQDPKLFVLPDLAAEMSAIDGNPELTEEEKMDRRRETQTAFMERSDRVHVVDQLLRAYSLYEKDVDYVVQPDQNGVPHVYIVDEFTGRVLPGRRWSDGLHQAVEAKEGVAIEKESQTLATITIQNYFRLYAKLSGMTGTAETEAREFKDIYKLDVVSIPTNKSVNRIDGNDQIYRTQREKYKAIIADVAARHEKGQPILLGTVTVDTSEVLSRMLKMSKIPHEVLNAKNHAREAEIVSQAGQRGAVTIATNMAGRGTDIKLGEGVTELGGLHVIGSERHESRRIDRQLRGRCSRQGDPGSSQFFISLEDNLMRLFGSQKLSGVMQRLGMKEGEVMEHKWLNRSVETAQRRVEQQHFAVRKRTLEFDDVMNRQRSIVYELRGRVLKGTPEEVHNLILDVMNDLIMSQAERYLFNEKDGQIGDFMNWLGVSFPVMVAEEEIRPLMGRPEEIGKLVMSRVEAAYEMKCASEDPITLPYMERGVFLQVIDREWQDYLRAMDDLRTGVNLRSYGQRDPLVEYKKEAFYMFETLMNTVKAKVVSTEFRCATAARMQKMMAHFAAEKKAMEEAEAREAKQARKEVEKPEKVEKVEKTEKVEKVEKPEPVKKSDPAQIKITVNPPASEAKPKIDLMNTVITVNATDSIAKAEKPEDKIKKVAEQVAEKIAEKVAEKVDAVNAASAKPAEEPAKPAEVKPAEAEAKPTEAPAKPEAEAAKPTEEAAKPAEASAKPLDILKPEAPKTVGEVFQSMMSETGRQLSKELQQKKPIKSSHPAVGRNDPCPCGSGKKYKKCCGRNIE